MMRTTRHNLQRYHSVTRYDGGKAHYVRSNATTGKNRLEGDTLASEREGDHIHTRQ
jgi:hypothetical protein